MTMKENYSHFPRLLNLVQSKTTKLHFVRASQVRQSTLFSTFAIYHRCISKLCEQIWKSHFKIKNPHFSDIWRFPYLCYKNGGGVFLLIYFISMIFCGIPVFLLEVSIGQYLGAGGMTTIAQICPMLKGTYVQFPKCKQSFTNVKSFNSGPDWGFKISILIHFGFQNGSNCH